MLFKLKKYNRLVFNISKNKKCKILFVIFLIISSIDLFGKTQTEKAEFLRQKNNELIEENLRTIDSTITAAYRLNDKSVLSEAYMEKGNYFLEQRNYNNALKNFTISNQISTEIKDDFFFYSSLFGIAKTKENLNQLKESIQLYEDCFTYFKKHKNQPKSFSIYLAVLGKLTYLYSKFNRLEKSEYYNKIELSETRDTLNYQYALKNKGIIDFYKKDYKAAFATLKHTQKTFLKQNDVKWYILTEQFLGEILYQQKKENEAVGYFKNVVAMSKEYRIVDEELRLSYERTLEYDEIHGNRKDKLTSINNLLSFDSLFYANDKTVLKSNYEKYENSFLKAERNQLKQKNINFRNFTFLGFSLLVISGGFFLYRVNQNYQRRKADLLSRIDNLTAKELRSKKIEKLKEIKTDLRTDSEFEKSLLSFEQRQLFLNPKISLNDLVVELNANRTIVSNYINRSRDKNFNQYINALRISYILERLKDEPDLKKYTIDALAEETGFNSRKTFSDAFLEHTGFRPSSFIRKFQV